MHSRMCLGSRVEGWNASRARQVLYQVPFLILRNGLEPTKYSVQLQTQFTVQGEVGLSGKQSMNPWQTGMAETRIATKHWTAGLSFPFFPYTLPPTYMAPDKGPLKRQRIFQTPSRKCLLLVGGMAATPGSTWGLCLTQSPTEAPRFVLRMPLEATHCRTPAAGPSTKSRPGEGFLDVGGSSYCFWGDPPKKQKVPDTSIFFRGSPPNGGFPLRFKPPKQVPSKQIWPISASGISGLVLDACATMLTSLGP